MFLSAIFLTLIVAIMAQIILTANAKVQQRNSTLYFTAVNLANEQFAMLESKENLSAGHYNFLGNENDLKSYNGVDEEKKHTPIEFKVFATVADYSESENLKEATVTVTWTVNGETENFESTKIISGGN